MANEKLGGVCLLLDVLDYMKILNTVGDHPSFSQVLDVSSFSDYLQGLPANIKRGDYALCLTNVVSPLK